MRKKWLVWALFFFAGLAASGARAGAPVWKVVKNNHQLFIGGTVHVLAPSDYPLPSEFEDAYKHSTEMVFEADIRKVKRPEFQKALLQNVVYSDGRSLKTVLNQNVYQELEEHLSSYNIPITAMINYKPGMVMVTLTALELERLGLSGTGVDEFFSTRAVEDQKAISQLETIEEQLDFIATMGDGWENEFVVYSLRDIEKLSQMMKTIKDAWRRGDMARLKEIVLNPFKKEFPKAYDQLILKRNNAWMPKIEAMLKSAKIEFVLVGALHLVGKEGLLAQLAARGYEIQPVEPMKER